MDNLYTNAGIPPLPEPMWSEYQDEARWQRVLEYDRLGPRRPDLNNDRPTKEWGPCPCGCHVGSHP